MINTKIPFQLFGLHALPVIIEGRKQEQENQWLNQKTPDVEKHIIVFLPWIGHEIQEQHDEDAIAYCIDEDGKPHDAPILEEHI